MTRHKSPTFNMGTTSPARDSTLGRGDAEFNLAPGQFGAEVKGFTIGEKREQHVDRTIGPGEYNLERADRLTKTRNPEITLGNSPSRPSAVG